MNGFIDLLKPPGLTSSAAVAKLKRQVLPDRIGHMGTLDPAAAGVLPVAVGKATRLFDFFLSKRKTYRAWFTFGVETDTLDSCGTVTCRKDCDFTEEQLLAALSRLTGDIEQVPPRYSAVSIGGRRAYDLARRGAEFTIRPKPVTVYEFRYLDQVAPDTYSFDITVSGGTYIRSLVADLAGLLGTVGILSALIRLSSGPFRIEDACTIEEAQADLSGVLIPVERLLADVPRLDVADGCFDKLKNGAALYAGSDFEAVPGTFRAYCRGELFGLGACGEDGRLRITAYLREG